MAKGTPKAPNHKVSKTSKKVIHKLSKKQQKAKAKTSKLLIEKLNKETTNEQIHDVSKSAMNSTSSDRDALPKKEAFKHIKNDNEADLKTLKEHKERNDRLENDLASQLELISGISL